MNIQLSVEKAMASKAVAMIALIVANDKVTAEHGMVANYSEETDAEKPKHSRGTHRITTESLHKPHRGSQVEGKHQWKIRAGLSMHFRNGLGIIAARRDTDTCCAAEAQVRLGPVRSVSTGFPLSASSGAQWTASIRDIGHHVETSNPLYLH